MNKGKKTVALCTGSFHTDYSRKMAQKVSKALRKNGFSVCLFQGLDASRFLTQVDYVDVGFDSHYYTQFEYSKYLNPDFLIISYGTISAIPHAMTVDELLDRLPRVPAIILESEIDRPDCISITFNNEIGMRRCVEHLVEDHQCKEVLFVSGPKGAPDAEIRLKAYRDVMKSHGYPVDDSMIACGDFTDHVDAQVEVLLSIHPHPDAIVCANDEMAESTYRVLKSHGLMPGRDVAVTGFDDNTAAPFMDPPLTSVRQDLDSLADNIIRSLKMLEDGQKPSSLVLPALLKIRQSCTCPAGDIQGRLDRSQLIEGWSERKQLANRNILTVLMLRKLLQENVSREEFFACLGRLLHSLGIAYSEIRLFQEPAVTDKESRIHIPDKLRLELRQKESSIEVYPEDAPHLVTVDTGCEYDGKVPLTAFPLFFGQTHYGVLILSLYKEDMLFCYSLSLEIGTGIRYLFMSLEQQENRAALEEQNQILDYSASHDSLTGLYNRAGLMRKIYSFIHSHEKNSRFVLVMGDLDHLKQINDTFGHSMGDTSIKAAADILRGALSAGSPLGRTGGDEFTAVFFVDETNDIDYFKLKLKNLIDLFNANSGLPVYVGITVGCTAFSGDQPISFSELIKETDRRLYEAKKHRRDSVIR